MISPRRNSAVPSGRETRTVWGRPREAHPCTRVMRLLLQIVHDDGPLALHHLPLPVHEMADGKVFVHGKTDAVEVALTEFVDKQGGFAQCL